MSMNCKDLGIDKLKVMVYGESGVGKTYFAGSFPDPYFFDFDGGMLTLRGKNVTYDTYMDMPGENPKAFTEAEKKIREFSSQIKAGTFPYKTIVIDGITSMQETLIADVRYLNNLAPNKALEIQHWGMITSKIAQFVSNARKLNCHVVALCQAIVEKDDLTGTIRTLPLVYGKSLPDNLPTMFDIVCCGELEMVGTTLKRKMRTVGDGRKKSKDRTGMLEAVELDFSYDSLMKKISEPVK